MWCIWRKFLFVLKSNSRVQLNSDNSHPRNSKNPFGPVYIKWKGSSTTKLYEELGWVSLSGRRWLRRFGQFYKIQNDLTPSYLKEPIPQPRTFLYGQRRENVLHEIPCRTSRFLNSFYPDTIRSWNNIGFEFRNSSSLSKFKSKLLSLIRPTQKSIFSIHDPCGIKLLFQLRVGLSPLKGHKKNHNFSDTPSAICDTIHFFICNFQD